MTFAEKLERSWQKADSLVCVGLDPETERLPASVRGQAKPFLAFCCAIADATADLVCAFKPQFAHFAGQGRLGELSELLAYLRTHHPAVPTILDAKRGDIGNTARYYAQEAFQVFGADAVTVSPYMGTDSLQPFLEDPERGVFILAKTSNPGSGDFQDLPIGEDQRPLFLHVAERAALSWNKQGNVGLVVGATYPEPLRQVRLTVGDIPLLVPGVGTQGGDLAAVLQAGLTASRSGLIINSSRGVLYASDGPDFAQAARAQVRALRQTINDHRH